MRLCDAAQGSLYTFADGALYLVALHASPELVALRRQEGPFRPQPGTLFYPLLTGERVVHFADVRESPAYRETPSVRERVDATSARSFLAVALLSTTVEFTDMRAISLGSVLDCSGMASERSGCF